MSQTSHNSKYNSKTMEKRNYKTESFICCIAHALTNNKTIIDDVAACEHNPFRESCSTGSVLHVYNIFWSNFSFNLMNDFNINMLKIKLI